MKRFFSAFRVALALALVALGPAAAVNPDEMLADPAREARAREISAELRCLVCQNQSIDDSDAELARDLRLLVRERLEQGDTDAEVIDYVVSRYGQFVLLKPRFSAATLLLWGTPVAALLAGIAALLLFARNRRTTRAAAPLTPEEEAEVARLMRGEAE